MAPPIRVMVVDDSTAIRGRLRKAFTDTGEIEVVATASTGKQAIERVDDSKVDVMILDIVMPEMT